MGFVIFANGEDRTSAHNRRVMTNTVLTGLDDSGRQHASALANSLRGLPRSPCKMPKVSVSARSQEVQSGPCVFAISEISGREPVRVRLVARTNNLADGVRIVKSPEKTIGYICA